MDRKRIVCFGDSNTWGYDASTGGRFPYDKRWTTMLQEMLGSEWEVISEGLSGRNAVCEDPLFEGLKGIDYIHPCLLSHSPVELAIIMLGTNDTKERFSLTSRNIAMGITRLAVKAGSVKAGPEGKGTRVLVVCPPPIKAKYAETEIGDAMGKDCDIKSKDLADNLSALLKIEGIPFFDSGKLIEMKSIDYMHLDAEGHRKMAHLMDELVRKMASGENLIDKEDDRQLSRNMRTKQEVHEAIRNKVVVSCQALADEPLHSAFIMGRMAYAAFLGGASGIRANSVVDIREIKKTVDLPIIGIIKQDYEGSEVYITPTMKEVDALCEEGVDIIAIDATIRMRPDGMTIKEAFPMIRAKYPNQLFMADCSNFEEAKLASELGFDYIGSTMAGYTPYTEGRALPALDLIERMVRELNKPVIAEGGISTPEELRAVLDLGVHSAVVGSAITRPMEITKRFIAAAYK